MKIKTRYKCKIIGSDYSAQEPRMNAHICEAYTNLPNKYYIDPALLPDKITSKADILAIKDDSEALSNTEYLVRLFEKELAKKPDDIDAAWDAVKAVINDPVRNPKLCVNKMKEAYMADKDLYAMIAQSAYNNKYEDNLEFYPEGTELEIDGKKVIAGHKTHKNPDGKDRRSTGKVLNLASSYGMSGPTAGIRLGYTGDEAREKGNELLDSFFRGFPAVDKAIEESKKFLKVNGYVEDFYGRRRHLGEINLPDYEIKPLEDEIAFNPFLNCNKPAKKSYAQLFWELIKDVYIDMGYSGQLSNSVYERLAKLAIYPNLWKQPCITQEELQIMIDRGDSQAKYGRFLKAKQFEMGKLNGTKFLNPKSGLYMVRRQLIEEKGEDGKSHYVILTNEEKLRADICEYLYITLVNEAALDEGERTKKGIHIDPMIELPTQPVLFIANTGRKAQAERQCFNARIQGGAATLTKLAMIDIANDQLMKDYHAKLIIPVHDELLVECPAYYADQVYDRLPKLMTGAAKKGGIEIPQKCDPYCVDRWYADEMAALLIDEYTKLIKGDAKKGIKPVSKSEALDVLYKDHCEIPAKSILDVIEGRTPDEVIF